MTREEITIHYEKLCFQYETIMSVLKQRNPQKKNTMTIWQIISAFCADLAKSR